MSAAVVKNIFQNFEPRLLDTSFADAAAVNLILFSDEQQKLNLLFIKRAQHPEDRWSGQIGFPGGKSEVSDLHLLHTAQRETFEEISLPLNNSHFIGQLSDIQGRKSDQLLPFYIRPFVSYLPSLPSLTASDEVAEIISLPLEDLFKKELHIAFPPRPALPAIRLSEQHILWGLSYLMVTELAKLWARHYHIDISFWPNIQSGSTT